MRIEAPRKLFTVAEFYKMADAGIFNEDDRVELIDGEILEMAPIGTRHLGCVNGAIGEVWVEDLKAGRLLVFRGATSSGYRDSSVFLLRDTITVAAFPGTPIRVRDLLG